MEERPPGSIEPSSSPSPPPPPPSPPPPPGGSPPGDGGPPPIPWEQPGTDIFSGFFRTIGLLLSSPRRAFERVPTTTSVLRPFAFAYVIQLIAVWMSTLWDVALSGVWRTFVPGIPDYQSSAASQILAAAAAPVWIVLLILVSVVLQHLFLILVGGARQGFGATLRALCYATTPSIIAVVPFCGTVVGAVWSVVLAVIGLSSLHRISTGRALFAVLLPLVLCCACAAIAVALFGTALLGAISAHR